MPPYVPLHRFEGQIREEKDAVFLVANAFFSGGNMGTRFKKPRVQLALLKERGATDAEIRAVLQPVLDADAAASLEAEKRAGALPVQHR